MNEDKKRERRSVRFKERWFYSEGKEEQNGNDSRGGKERKKELTKKRKERKEGL